MEIAGCLTEEELFSRLTPAQLAAWIVYLRIKEERRIEELKAIHGAK